MDLCIRGHDKDVSGRRKDGGCLECKRQANRARYADPNYRATNQARMREKRRPVTPDGWEDEFGPVPPPEARPEDWVVTLRASQAARAARIQAGEGPPIVRRDPGRPERLRSGIQGVSRSGLTPWVRSW